MRFNKKAGAITLAYCALMEWIYELPYQQERIKLNIKGLKHRCNDSGKGIAKKNKGE